MDLAGPAATFVTTAERRRAAGAVPRDARGARDLRPVTPAAVMRGCVLADIDIVNYTIPKGFDSTRRCPRGLYKRPAGCPSTDRGSSRRVTGRERRERVALLTGGARSVRVEKHVVPETRGWLFHDPTLETQLWRLKPPVCSYYLLIRNN